MKMINDDYENDDDEDDDHDDDDFLKGLIGRMLLTLPEMILGQGCWLCLEASYSIV